jgi:hypothetical protein
MRFFEGNKVNQVNSPPPQKKKKKKKRKGERNPKTEEKVNPRKVKLSE